MFQNIGEMVLLLWRTLRSLPLVFRQRFKIYDQLFEIGNASLLMACILSIFIGGGVTLQNGPFLAGRGLASAHGGNLGFSLLIGRAHDCTPGTFLYSLTSSCFQTNIATRRCR